jgi:hypothetical protein
LQRHETRSALSRFNPTLVAVTKPVEEMFLVWRGRFRVKFKERIVELGPASLSSCPAVPNIARLQTRKPRCLLVESSGVLNTGNVIDEKSTAAMGTRI